MVAKKEGSWKKKADAQVMPAVVEAQNARITICFVAGTATLMFIENE